MEGISGEYLVFYIKSVMISWVREQRYQALLIKQLAINECNRIIIIPLYIEMCLLRSPHTKGVYY